VLVEPVLLDGAELLVGLDLRGVLDQGFVVGHHDVLALHAGLGQRDEAGLPPNMPVWTVTNVPS